MECVDFGWPMFVFCELNTTIHWGPWILWSSVECTHTHTHTRAEYLPDIERLAQQREKQFKKKMLAELPRRTSDRIAIKAAQKIEEVSQWHDGRIHVGVTGRKPTSHVSTTFWLLFDLFSLLHCNSTRGLKFNFHGSTLLCGSKLWNYTNKRSNLINPI